MGTEAITAREQQIIELISKGFNSPQIAERLNISVRTIDTHRANAMRKLDVNNAEDMVIKCKEAKIIGL